MAELNVRYATALFDLAAECGMLNEYFDQVVAVRDALQSDEGRSFMEHPDISDKDKHEFLEAVFAGNLYDDIKGFLYLLIAKNREKLIVPALSAFIDLVDSHNGKTTAAVVSAVQLNEQQISSLKNVLEKKLNKQVEISAKVDSSLIGGLYIHVDGYFIDYTVRKQLNDLKDSIKGGTYDD